MTSLTKALGVITVLALSACTTPNITGGSFTGNAGATVQDGQVVPEIDATIKLQFSTEPAEEATPKPADEQPPAASDETEIKPLLDLIGFAEGTDKGDGFNETLAYGAFTNGDVILTDMTLAEIDTLQTAMLQHQDNHFNSSAIGRYQIVRTTLRGLKKDLGLNDTEKFTPALQNRLARALLEGRGFSRWKSGQLDDKRFALNLAKEWASLPNPHTGKSVYSDQNAAVGYAGVEAILDKLK